MTLVRYGGLAVVETDPLKAPWWYAVIVQIWTRIQNIKESAAYDVDKTPPPKDYWLDDDQLNDWYAEREKLRNVPRPLSD